MGGARRARPPPDPPMILLPVNTSQDINENENGRCNQSHTLLAQGNSKLY